MMVKLLAYAPRRRQKSVSSRKPVCYAPAPFGEPKPRCFTTFENQRQGAKILACTPSSVGWRSLGRGLSPAL